MSKDKIKMGHIMVHLAQYCKTVTKITYLFFAQGEPTRGGGAFT